MPPPVIPIPATAGWPQVRPPSSLSIEDPAQEPHELAALLGGQRAEQLVLHPLDDTVQLGQSPTPGGGDRDDVPAPVLRIGLALGVAAVDQVVHDRVGVAAVDAA